MTALDFLLYCMGTGVVMVSGAHAFRTVRGAPRPVEPTKAVNKVEVNPVDPGGLAERLQSFQTQRYSSPLLRRQLSPSEGPRPTLPPLPRAVAAPKPIPRLAQTPQAPVAAPPKVEEKRDNVVPLPLKMKPPGNKTPDDEE